MSSRTTASLTITWQSDSGGEFDHYKIKIDSQPAIEIEKTSSQQQTFSDLNPGSSHTIQLWTEAGTERSSIVQLNDVYTSERCTNIIIASYMQQVFTLTVVHCVNILLA